MGTQQALFDAFLGGVNTLHRAVLAISGGRLGGTIAGMPAVELHTTGRTSGKRRSVMLTAPVYEPDRVVLVASKGGDDRDPDWYRNLVANPARRAHGRRRHPPDACPHRVRHGTPELWPRIVAAYKGYDSYRQRTDRQIPVVILEAD